MRVRTTQRVTLSQGFVTARVLDTMGPTATTLFATLHVCTESAVDLTSVHVNLATREKLAIAFVPLASTETVPCPVCVRMALIANP